MREQYVILACSRPLRPSSVRAFALPASPEGKLQTVEKPLTGFSDKFLQSAARTPCSPMANNSHTCSLRCIFCQVHAPTENDLILFGGLRRQTLRGFFDKLQLPRRGSFFADSL